MKKVMKNVLIGFVIFFSVLGMTAFGKGMMGKMFKDDDKIPGWAKEGVEDMYNGGVIEGFSVGDEKEFRGDEPLTRAQMAVMMSRYDKKIRTSAFIGFIHSLDKLGYIDVKDDYAAAAIMAEAGMMKVKNKPELEEGIEDKELTSDSLPEGYTYIFPYMGTFYLHFVGERFVGQDFINVDQWYGPFYVHMLEADQT